jgi:hypothetical protein
MNAILKSGLLWLHGLAAVFIGGAANSIAAAIIKPEAFNFGAQWRDTLMLALVSGGICAIAYLAKSPVPPIPEIPINKEKR